MTLDELKRENEILKDALCLEQDRLSFARHHLQNAQDRIKRLEEELMDTKNKHAVLVADVVLNEDRADRIKQLEEENDAMRADLLLWKDWVEEEKGKQ